MSRYNRFNWQRADSFEWKFKRQPKLRTISEVHDLYLRALERSVKKSKEVMDCIAEIVRDIPPTAAYNNRYNDNRNDDRGNDRGENHGNGNNGKGNNGRGNGKH